MTTRGGREYWKWRTKLTDCVQYQDLPSAWSTPVYEERCQWRPQWWLHSYHKCEDPSEASVLQRPHNCCCKLDPIMTGICLPKLSPLTRNNIPVYQSQWIWCDCWWAHQASLAQGTMTCPFVYLFWPEKGSYLPKTVWPGLNAKTFYPNHQSISSFRCQLSVWDNLNLGRNSCHYYDQTEIRLKNSSVARAPYWQTKDPGLNASLAFGWAAKYGRLVPTRTIILKTKLTWL